jgi:SPP1 family predicted phage head-tail adaptor
MRKTKLFSLLKHKINILENRSVSQLDADEWKIKTQTFAEVKQIFDSKIGSVERFDFGHIITEGYIMFKIRYIPGITTKMRVVFKNRMFEIKRVIDPNESERVLKIIAIEI